MEDGPLLLHGLILNLDRQKMQNEGWTFSWMNASNEWGYDFDNDYSNDALGYNGEDFY